MNELEEFNPDNDPVLQRLESALTTLREAINGSTTEKQLAAIEAQIQKINEQIIIRRHAIAAS